MALKQTIGLVDNERGILIALSARFESEGFNVLTYRDGMAALEGLTERPVDLAILDIKMPRMDGIDLFKRLKQLYPTLPIIFLTTRDDEVDEQYGLALGAADYIVKPFSSDLVVARTRAVLRRYKSDLLPPADTESTVVLGKLKYDPERYVCSWNGNNVKLSLSEFLILKALAERPGITKTREVLATTAWDADTFVDDRTVDNHVMRIRKRFKEGDPSFDPMNDLILTVRGVGYRLKTD
jgi:two-component system response regulator ChvI